jgi:hypothetical protein
LSLKTEKTVRSAKLFGWLKPVEIAVQLSSSVGRVGLKLVFKSFEILFVRSVCSVQFCFSSVFLFDSSNAFGQFKLSVCIGETFVN